MAILTFYPREMSFPKERAIPRPGEIFGHILGRSIKPPGVYPHDLDAAIREQERGVSPHAASFFGIFGLPPVFVGSGHDQGDIERLDRVSNLAKSLFYVVRLDSLAVGLVPHIEREPIGKAPFERNLVDRSAGLPSAVG